MLTFCVDLRIDGELYPQTFFVEADNADAAALEALRNAGQTHPGAKIEVASVYVPDEEDENDYHVPNFEVMISCSECETFVRVYAENEAIAQCIALDRVIEEAAHLDWFDANNGGEYSGIPVQNGELMGDLAVVSCDPIDPSEDDFSDSLSCGCCACCGCSCGDD
jgi:hypothetical protein